MQAEKAVSSCIFNIPIGCQLSFSESFSFKGYKIATGFVIFKWFHCMVFRRCTCSCSPMLICSVWGMCFPTQRWEEGTLVVLLLTLPTARCLRWFWAAAGPGLAILRCSVACKMSCCRKGKASLSRSQLQSTSFFQRKANHVMNCNATFWDFYPFPFSFRTPVFRHQRVLTPARRRQVEVCVDALFLLGFCPLQLMGMS